MPAPALASAASSRSSTRTAPTNLPDLSITGSDRKSCTWMISAASPRSVSSETAIGSPVIAAAQHLGGHPGVRRTQHGSGATIVTGLDESSALADGAARQVASQISRAHPCNGLLQTLGAARQPLIDHRKVRDRYCAPHDLL